MIVSEGLPGDKAKAVQAIQFIKRLFYLTARAVNKEG
jgi:hypothetical protein